MVVGFHLNICYGNRLRVKYIGSWLSQKYNWVDQTIVLEPTFSCSHTRVKNATKVVFSCIFKFDSKNLKVIVIDNLLRGR